MTGETEEVRRSLVKVVNTHPGSRGRLEEQYGRVWNTEELRREYDVLGFQAPYVVVVRKEDGVKGSLMFQHDPRLYFGFEAYAE